MPKQTTKRESAQELTKKEENFGVVAALRMDWRDPALASNPERCERRWKLFQLNDFRQYVREQATVWPEFTLPNQQGRRWEQNQVVVVFPRVATPFTLSAFRPRCRRRILTFGYFRLTASYSSSESIRCFQSNSSGLRT